MKYLLIILLLVGCQANIVLNESSKTEVLHSKDKIEESDRELIRRQHKSDFGKLPNEESWQHFEPSNATLDNMGAYVDYWRNAGRSDQQIQIELDKMNKTRDVILKTWGSPRIRYSIFENEVISSRTIQN
jgi:hypothetical protein